MTWEEISAAILEKVKAAKEAVTTEGLADEEKQRATNEALASELKNLPHEVRQFLHDGGHRQATAQNAQKLKEAEEAKQQLAEAKSALEEQVKEHKARLTELEAKTPEAAEVREKLQKEFAQREESLEAKVREAEEKAAKLQDARKQDKVDGFENRLRARLGVHVTEEGEEWMRNRIDRMRLDGRFVPKDASGNGTLGVGVLRPNSTELEYHASSEDELLGVVSQEVLEGAPKWAVKSNVKGGGGAQGGPAGSAKTQWDAIRDKAKSRAATGPDQEAVNKRRSALLGES